MRKDFNEYKKSKLQNWMETDYDNNVLERWKLPKGNYIVKYKKDNSLDGDNDVKTHCQVI